MRPTFLALRYELDTMTRDIVNTKYLIKSYLPLEMKYDVPNYFNFTLLEQRVDTFIDVVTFSGYLTTYRKGLSMPFSINMRLRPTDLLLPKVRIIFEPFKDTMEVKTFYEVFNITPDVYNNLAMPKGIGTINTLPVDFVTVYY